MKNVLPFCYFFICFSIMLITPAYAYLDPSVATYTIQVIAGLAVTVGAVAGIYWRRAKRNIENKLGIDENRNKEVEEEFAVKTAEEKSADEQK